MSETEFLELMKDLWVRGVRLTIEADRLRCAAPTGVLTLELQEKLRSHKAQLIAALQANSHEALSKRRPSIQRVDRSKSYALSFAQRRIWMIHQMGLGSIAYHFTGKMVVEGELDLDVWRKGWSLLVQRHEALRTFFVEEEGEPRQRILEQASSEIPLIDLSALSCKEQDRALETLIPKQSVERFDLSQAPLTRQCVVKRGERAYIFLITIHHIISDGWSVGNLLRDLLLHYRREVFGEKLELPELKAQHIDYSEWQNAHLNERELERQLGYWRKQLEGAPPLLTLPTDRPRLAVERYLGRSIDLSLGQERTARVRALCKEKAVTPFMVMTAGLNVLLHLYSGQSDIMMGTVVANRQHEEVENLMGIFINTLVLRSRVQPQETFLQHLVQVRDTALEAFAHQDLPFEQLVEAVKPDRSPSYNPLFQVMLLMQNTPMPSINLSGFRIEVSEVSSATAPFDLTFTLAESGANIIGTLKYNTDLFDEETIHRMANRLYQLVDVILQNPAAKLCDIIIEEGTALRPALLAQHPQICPYECFEQVAATNPHRVAITDAGQSWTYGWVNARANRLARLLRQHGITTEKVVGLYMRRSADLIVAMLAVGKAGGVYMPIDPAYPEARITYMLEKSRAIVLLTDNHLRGRLMLKQCTEICLTDSEPLLAKASSQNLGLQISPGNLIYIIFTSGSTGRPKGVAITQQNVARLLSSARNCFHFEKTDAWTFFHSAAFDFSVWEIWMPLVSGARVVVVDYETSRDPQKFFELLTDEQITVVNQTPTAFSLWSDIATSRGARIHHLRYVIFAGEELNPRLLAEWFRVFGDRQPKIINMYGITETTVHVTFRRIVGEDLIAESLRSYIGAPLDDLAIHLMSPSDHVVLAGIDGEIHVAGAGLARCYINDPRETAKRFIPNFVTEDPRYTRLYRSGDLARQLLNEDLIYLGRIDSQVKIRGFRVELGEIERVIASYPGIVTAMARVVDKDTHRECIGAYYVARTGVTIIAHEVREHVRKQLPEYMIPRYFMLLDAIPLTGNGKLDIARLPKPSLEQNDAQFGNLPRNGREKRLTEIWCQLLEIPQVGMEDNFFQIGGHSLIALKMLNVVKKEYNCEISFEAFFRHATVRSLAAMLPVQSTPNALDQILSTYAKHSGIV